MSNPLLSTSCVLATALAAFLTACGPDAGDDTAQRTGQPQVYVVNYPLQFFAQRIGGEHVQVHFPAPAEVDPAFWHPDDQTIARYQHADLILLNGAEYAHWVQHATLPRAATVNTTGHLRDRLLEVEGVTHSHGPHGTHTHHHLASTTWLDLTLAIEQARAVADALGELLPDHKESFAQRFGELEAELSALDAELRQIAGQSPDKPLLASHPVYHYLEDRYALNLHSLEWEPDEVPSEDEWEVLDRVLADHPAMWMIWEDEPMPETVSQLEVRGVHSIVFNPYSQPPTEGDFLTGMRGNIENLRLAFSADINPE